MRRRQAGRLTKPMSSQFNNNGARLLAKDYRNRRLMSVSDMPLRAGKMAAEISSRFQCKVMLRSAIATSDNA